MVHQDAAGRSLSGLRWQLRGLGRALRSPEPANALPGGKPELLERLNPAGRETLDAAREEARTLGHRTVGTEHLLLALACSTGSSACELMERMGTTPARIRAEVLEAIVPGPGTSSGRLAFTPRARLAVELAHRASLQIGVSETGTEHLLIGLAAEGEGIAAKVLARSGIITRTAKSQVISDLDGKLPL